jgi:hypothetical protein
MRALLASLLLLTAACLPTSEGQAPERPAELVPVELPAGHPPLLPDPEANGGHAGRAPRRLTVAQLRQSLLTTLGTTWSQLDNRAPSLGQADFALVNAESIEPNLVFAKFLEDGAREVCLATAAADLARPARDRVLTAELPPSVTDFTTLAEADVRRNLSALSLRFWGLPFSEAELGTWTQTFQRIATRVKAGNLLRSQAWGTMCVAFLTDPRFLTY